MRFSGRTGNRRCGRGGRSDVWSSYWVTRLAGAEPLLLVESGSAVAASARATLSSVPVAGEVTVTVRDRLALLARVATDGQVTMPPASDPALLAETKVTPAGRGSPTTTADASHGTLVV